MKRLFFLTDVDTICYNIYMKLYNLYLAEKQIENLKKLSTETGLSVSEHIRRAIDEYLAKQKREIKENA